MVSSKNRISSNGNVCRKKSYRIAFKKDNRHHIATKFDHRSSPTEVIKIAIFVIYQTL